MKNNGISLLKNAKFFDEPPGFNFDE